MTFLETTGGACICAIHHFSIMASGSLQVKLRFAFSLLKGYRNNEAYMNKLHILDNFSFSFLISYLENII